MDIIYSVLNPTGNITVLVQSPVEKGDRPAVASRLMQAEPAAEQVGFVDGTELNMAGGEFCGNATLCAVVLYVSNNCPNCTSLLMTVSGAKEKVYVETVKKSETEYDGRITMPMPVSVSVRELEFDGKKITVPVVELPGIHHIIFFGKPDRSLAEKQIKKWCADLKAESLGLMYADEKNGELIPLVYVPAADTLFWESSCASGTTATGVWLSYKYNEKVSLKFRQPGGTLGIEAEPGKAPVLEGRVKILKTNKKLEFLCDDYK